MSPSDRIFRVMARLSRCREIRPVEANKIIERMAKKWSGMWWSTYLACEVNSPMRWLGGALVIDLQEMKKNRGVVFWNEAEKEAFYEERMFSYIKDRDEIIYGRILVQELEWYGTKHFINKLKKEICNGEKFANSR